MECIVLRPFAVATLSTNIFCSENQQTFPLFAWFCQVFLPHGDGYPGFSVRVYVYVIMKSKNWINGVDDEGGTDDAGGTFKVRYWFQNRWLQAIGMQATSAIAWLFEISVALSALGICPNKIDCHREMRHATVMFTWEVNNLSNISIFFIISKQSYIQESFFTYISIKSRVKTGKNNMYSLKSKPVGKFWRTCYFVSRESLRTICKRVSSQLHVKASTLCFTTSRFMIIEVKRFYLLFKGCVLIRFASGFPPHVQQQADLSPVPSFVQTPPARLRNYWVRPNSKLGHFITLRSPPGWGTYLLSRAP